MSRPLRIEYPDAWYHVMNRGRKREKIFSCIKDYTLFIGLLKESCYMWHVRIGAFCLLPNHYHILIQSRNVAIYLIKVLRCEGLEEIGRDFDMTRYSSVSSVIG